MHANAPQDRPGYVIGHSMHQKRGRAVIGYAGVQSSWRENRPDRSVKRFIAPASLRCYAGVYR